jgi:hypothetical protein
MQVYRLRWPFSCSFPPDRKLRPCCQKTSDFTPIIPFDEFKQRVISYRRLLASSTTQRPCSTRRESEIYPNDHKTTDKDSGSYLPTVPSNTRRFFSCSCRIRSSTVPSAMKRTALMGRHWPTCTQQIRHVVRTKSTRNKENLYPLTETVGAINCLHFCCRVPFGIQ